MLFKMHMMIQGVIAVQVLVFVVFAATDARRASLEAHIPVSAGAAVYVSAPCCTCIGMMFRLAS
jgi:hypothetical protein